MLAGCLAGALVLAPMPSAWASPPAPPPSKAELAAAKKHYGEGDKKFKAGDYAGAEADFKAANDIKAAPQTERYIGLCEDALGHFPVAVEWYERFLAHVPDKHGHARRRDPQARGARSRRMPGKVHIDSNPPGASVAIDDKPQTAPTPMDVELAPGPHIVKLTEPGRLPTQKPIDVAFASHQTVLGRPRPRAAAAPASAAARGRDSAASAARATASAARAAQQGARVRHRRARHRRRRRRHGVRHHGAERQERLRQEPDDADGRQRRHARAHLRHGLRRRADVRRDERRPLPHPDDEPPATSSTHSKTTTAKASNPMTSRATPVVGPHSGGAGLTLRF